MNIDPSLFKVQVGGQVDRKMLSDCAIVAQIGGDPNDYIDKLIQNRGKRIDFFEGEDLVMEISDRPVTGYSNRLQYISNMTHLSIRD